MSKFHKSRVIIRRISAYARLRYRLDKFRHRASLYGDLPSPDAVSWTQGERKASRLVVVLIYRIVKPAFRGEGVGVVEVPRRMGSHVLAVENVSLNLC